MRALITGSIVALAFGVTAAAQDSTVKTQTKVDGDDARAVTMRGCLQQTAGSGFLLLGGVTASGDELTSKSTVKTDVDDDTKTVTSRTRTEIDKDDKDKTVGTSGTATNYTVMPRDGVDLAMHAGKEVELTAVMIDARVGGDKDAEVKVEQKTKVEADDAPDTKVESTSKADVPRGATPRLMAMSVKSLGQSCSLN
jgi:hypothetical protein